MKFTNIISQITKVVLAAAFVFIGLSSFSQTTENLGGYDFGIDTDDEGQYYKVDCPEALSAIVSYTKNAYASGKRFKQTADITLSGTFEPLHYVFSGIYDGNNMTISGLFTQRSYRPALFGYLKNATVKNVILLNPSNEATASDEEDIASLVGYSLESRIENCKVINPSLTWKHSNPYIGVIVAECDDACTIKDCYIYSKYSAIGHYVNTCTMKNVDRMYKITSKDCSFSSSTMVTVDGTDYYPNGTKITLSSTNPIPTGYYESYKVNGTAINGNIYTINGADVEITTATSPISYSITYNGIDGATFATTNPSSYTVESDEITIANPTHEGYTFLGWTYDGQTEPIKNVTIPKGSTGNKTFVANWAKILTNSDISVSDIAAQTYTGSAIEPEITVTDGEKTLVLGTDYEVSYSDNTNVGTATVTITGINNYSGTVEKTFEIKSENNQGGDNQGGDNQGEENQGGENQGEENQSEENQGGNNQGGENPSTPVSEITPNSGIKVWSYNHTIYIENAADTKYKIIDLQGRTITTSTVKSDREEVVVPNRNNSIAIVIINGKSFKLKI